MEVVKFTDIPGIKVGHSSNVEAATGCTVIICEKGAAAGVDVRGGAPGTRETDLLDPVNLVQEIHAVMLAGGSAFGLDAASGAMKYLEEKGIGFDVGVTRVPIVASAVLFDLAIGDHRVRPDLTMGYRACENATDKECPEGNVGAGTGATVGKIRGMEYAMKGGLGTYCLKVGELYIGAVVAVNCFGDVIDPSTGKPVAGVLKDDKSGISCTEDIMTAGYDKDKNLFSGNTTIGVIATNARMNKAQAKKVASMAHNGYAKTIRPAHSMVDGDTIFTMATGDIEADINVVGLLAAKVMEQAVLRAVKQADSLAGLKCYADLNK